MLHRMSAMRRKLIKSTRRVVAIIIDTSWWLVSRQFETSMSHGREFTTIAKRDFTLFSFYLYSECLFLSHLSGNVSKFIGDEEAELGTNVTHKWLVYMATKTNVPIEQIVSRARFHLHESYKPNDVIDVK